VVGSATSAAVLTRCAAYSPISSSPAAPITASSPRRGFPARPGGPGRPGGRVARAAARRVTISVAPVR
jgi:hypothetical protein